MPPMRRSMCSEDLPAEVAPSGSVSFITTASSSNWDWLLPPGSSCAGIRQNPWWHTESTVELARQVLECDECGEFDDGVLVKMTLQSLDEAIIKPRKSGANVPTVVPNQRAFLSRLPYCRLMTLYVQANTNPVMRPIIDRPIIP